MMMLSEAELKEFKKKQQEKEKKNADDIEKKNADAIRPVKRPASAYANPQKSAETVGMDTTLAPNLAAIRTASGLIPPTASFKVTEPVTKRPGYIRCKVEASGAVE